MGFLEPVAAFVASFIFLGILIYRRVALGITLNLTAIVLSMLFLELIDVGNVFWETLTDFVTISLVLATFGIMLLSQLYKETGFVTTLSQSLSEIVRNSKLVMSILPAVMGLLPVPGCAIISAPMIEAEAKRLKLDKAKQTYVNVWFRHTILPVYPMSPFLILTGALTGLSIISLIFRQVPVVIAMLAIGYMVGFSKVPAVKHESSRRSLTTNLAFLLKAFTPILTMLFAMITLKIDAWIAAFLGVGVLLLMARPSLNVFSRPFRSRAIYEVALAAFGAMLLRNVTVASGLSDNVGNLIVGWNMSHVLVLSILPTFLGFFAGSPSGGLAISVSMLAGTLSFTPKTISLLYMATYIGYVGAPTHLCLVLTADYFKCPMNQIYKYLVPSLVMAFMAAVLVYFLL